MKQLKAFNQAIAGSVPLACLQNTRKGYGIGAKYPTAWQAWLNTQQHKDRNFPSLDIPLYYSFTHTINKVRDNYGHINVRLANGRVWSDGKLYSSLTAFEQAFSNVKYVGWGESINDVKIIETGGDMHDTWTAEDTNYWVAYYNLPKDTFKPHEGKPLRDATFALLSEGSLLDFELKVNQGDVDNYNKMFNITNAGNYLKQLHKKFVYDLKLPPTDFVEYNQPKLFVKKEE